MAVTNAAKLRRSWAAPFDYMMKGKHFAPALQGVENPVLSGLRQLIRTYPKNITYDLDNLGLNAVSTEKFRIYSQAVGMLNILDSNPAAEVVIFGEDHVRSRVAHALIRDSMPILSERAFKGYGVELHRVDNYDLIEELEQGGAVEREKLLQFISNPINTSFAAEAAPTRMQLFDLAKELGLKITPLSNPLSWDPISLIPEMPFFLDSKLWDDAHARDCFMALATNWALQACNKMLVLAGLGHIDVNNGLPVVLNGFGYKVISIALIEREDVKEPFMVKYTAEIRKLIPLFGYGNYHPQDRIPQDAHWLVFLPHKPKDGSL